MSYIILWLPIPFFLCEFEDSMHLAAHWALHQTEPKAASAKAKGEWAALEKTARGGR